MDNITYDLGVYELLNEALQAADRQEDRYDEVIVVDDKLDGKSVYRVAGAKPCT